MVAEQCPIKALQCSLLKGSYAVQRIQTHTHTNLPVGWERKSRLVLFISNIASDMATSVTLTGHQ